MTQSLTVDQDRLCGAQTSPHQAIYLWPCDRTGVRSCSVAEQILLSFFSFSFCVPAFVTDYGFLGFPTGSESTCLVSINSTLILIRNGYQCWDLVWVSSAESVDWIWLIGLSIVLGGLLVLTFIAGLIKVVINKRRHVLRIRLQISLIKFQAQKEHREIGCRSRFQIDRQGEVGQRSRGR